MKHDCIGIGNPMLDLLVRVDDALLSRLGLKKGLFTLVDRATSQATLAAVADLPKDVAAGDATANTLAGLANLGHDCLFVGRIGEDGNGRRYVELTEESRCRHAFAKNPEVPTGAVVALITPDSQRTFATYLGAALTLRVEDLPLPEVAQSRFLYLTGYQIDDPGLRKVALAALAEAKKHGVKVGIDLADVGVIERNRDLLAQLVRDHAEVFFANEPEGFAFTGETDPERALGRMARLAPVACLKLAERGSLIHAEGRVTRVAPVPAKAVDTTGAGDIYAAGVVHGLLSGLSPEEYGRVASVISSHIVSRMGARTREDLRKMVGG